MASTASRSLPAVSIPQKSDFVNERTMAVAAKGPVNLYPYDCSDHHRERQADHHSNEKVKGLAKVKNRKTIHYYPLCFIIGGLRGDVNKKQPIRPPLGVDGLQNGLYGLSITRTSQATRGPSGSLKSACGWLGNQYRLHQSTRQLGCLVESLRYDQISVSCFSPP